MSRTEKFFLLFTTCITMFMINLDFTVVNLALPKIAQDLNSSMSKIQWVMNGFFIVTAAFMVGGGRLGDIYGCKKTALIGVVLFVLASCGAGLSTFSSELIGFRLLQGLGFAIVFPAFYALIGKSFSVEEKGFAFGIIAAVIGLAQGVGPSIGGVILQFLSWRWVFFINIPFGILIILLAVFSIKRQARVDERFDLIGMLLFAAALIVWIFAANSVHVWGFGSFSFIGCLIFGLLLLIGFLMFERFRKHPLFNLSLLKNRQYVLINIVRISIQLPYFCFLFMFGLMMINVKMYSDLKAGIIMLAVASTFFLVSLFAGKIIKLIGVKRALIWGSILNIVTFIWFAQLSIHTGLWQYIVCMIVFGAASGMLVPITATAMLESVTKDEMGAATGLFSTIGFVSVAFGIAGCGYMLAWKTGALLKQYLSQSNMLITTGQQTMLLSVSDGTSSLAGLQHVFPAVQQKILTPVLASNFIQAYSIVMYVMLGFAVLGLVASLGLRCGKR